MISPMSLCLRVGHPQMRYENETRLHTNVYSHCPIQRIHFLNSKPSLLLKSAHYERINIHTKNSVSWPCHFRSNHPTFQCVPVDKLHVGDWRENTVIPSYNWMSGHLVMKWLVPRFPTHQDPEYKTTESTELEFVLTLWLSLIEHYHTVGHGWARWWDTIMQLCRYLTCLNEYTSQKYSMASHGLVCKEPNIYGGIRYTHIKESYSSYVIWHHGWVTRTSCTLSIQNHINWFFKKSFLITWS